ncbi:hypothetical protein FRC09_006445 [Ceratobasidium sp. 395]|nr:hypothetical protein FRC09_006445 [Ceratobasidium sp. 395]
MVKSLKEFTVTNYAQIRDWCQSRILLTRPNQIGLRAQYITYFTRVAEECLQMGSFSTAHAITMGLSSDSVMGLTFTWQLVNKRTKDSLKHISSIVTDTSNYMTNLQSDSQATSVPILTIHLLELRKAHEKLAAYIVEDGEQLINFRAFEELWRNVKEVVKYKVPEGYIPRDPVVSEYLDYAFSQVQDGPDRLLEDRIAKLAREEKWFYKNHRLEPAAAGTGKTSK